MKANIETLEPVIRPVAATKPVARPVRAPRFLGVGAASTPALFHAWRA